MSIFRKGNVTGCFIASPARLTASRRRLRLFAGSVTTRLTFESALSWVSSADQFVEDGQTVLLRALSFWKARQGLEESTSEAELSVTGFACKGGTANAIMLAGLRLFSRFGIQP